MRCSVSVVIRPFPWRTTLAGGGWRGVKNLSISDGDAAHIVNVAPVVATPAAKGFNLGHEI